MTQEEASPEELVDVLLRGDEPETSQLLVAGALVACEGTHYRIVLERAGPSDGPTPSQAGEDGLLRRLARRCLPRA